MSTMASSQTPQTDELRVPLLGGDEEELETSGGALLGGEDGIEVGYRMFDEDGNSVRQRAAVEQNSLVVAERRLGGGADVHLKDARKKKMQYSGSEMIVAVFVVAFDTKRGNVLEWKFPPEAVLDDNIEFKSMASGLHNITTDFIYFKQKQLFGLSCYEKIPVASQEERGARMKSVGLLAVGYSDLHHHMAFLKRQVRVHVETPGDYGSLEEYFRHYRNPRSVDRTDHDVISNGLQPPVGCLVDLVQFYGPKVFVLWKLVLLKKRILFFSAPPIGEVCHRVVSACLLTNQILRPDLDTDCSPQFYVNVSDIDRLRELDSYVACTTEKIFQSKTELYDVFIDGQDFHFTSNGILPITRVTPWDDRKYAHLSNIRSADARGKARDNLTFIEYFTEQNSQLLRGMLDAEDSEDHVMTVEMVEGLQLDHSRDRLFLTALAYTWGLNVTMQHSSDVFTCCL